jgi:hypothetical protein
MKHLKLLPVLLLSMSSVAAPPSGSSWKDVKVSDVTIYAAGGPTGKGHLVITFSSNGMGTPNCASGYPRNLLIDISTPGGAMAAAVLQSGMILNSTVTVTGTGTCSVIANTETLASIQMQPIR